MRYNFSFVFHFCCSLLLFRVSGFYVPLIVAICYFCTPLIGYPKWFSFICLAFFLFIPHVHTAVMSLDLWNVPQKFSAKLNNRASEPASVQHQASSVFSRSFIQPFTSIKFYSVSRLNSTKNHCFRVTKTNHKKTKTNHNQKVWRVGPENV